MELTPLLFGAYKLVKYGVYPLTWIVILAGLTMRLAWLPPSPARQRRLRLSATTLVALLLILTSPLAAHLIVATLEGHHPPAARSTPIVNGTIVVLGGGLRESGSLRPRIELSAESMRQTVCGADLHRQGAAPTLLITGGTARIFETGPTEATVMKEWAVRLGVPAESILTENQARTTYENAVKTKHLLGNRTAIILVTSAIHMPRAAALFRTQGFDVSPSPCGFYEKHLAAEGWDSLSIFDVLPSASAFRSIAEAIEELAGIAVYRLAGKL